MYVCLSGDAFLKFYIYFLETSPLHWLRDNLTLPVEWLTDPTASFHPYYFTPYMHSCHVQIFLSWFQFKFFNWCYAHDILNVQLFYIFKSSFQYVFVHSLHLHWNYSTITLNCLPQICPLLFIEPLLLCSLFNIYTPLLFPGEFYAFISNYYSCNINAWNL